MYYKKKTKTKVINNVDELFLFWKIEVSPWYRDNLDTLTKYILYYNIFAEKYPGLKHKYEQ